MFIDFFQFWKSLFNTDFIYLFNLAIDKMDMITAKKVRNTC